MTTQLPEPEPVSPVSPESSPVERLRRWEDAGAVWRVASEGSAGLTIALLRCDGGEEVDRLVSADPDLVAFVRARSGHEW